MQNRTGDAGAAAWVVPPSCAQDSNLLRLFTRQLLFPDELSRRAWFQPASNRRPRGESAESLSAERWNLGVTGGTCTHKDRDHNPARLLIPPGHSTAPRIRTETDAPLRRVPLPIGLGRCVQYPERDSNPHVFRHR